MDNKDNPIGDINTEESKESAVDNNPFFVKPQDRPDNVNSSSDINEEEGFDELLENKEQDETMISDETTDIRGVKKDKKTFQKLFKKENSGNAKVKQLEKEKEKLSVEFENLKSQYLRLAADFDNYRKRQDQERQDLIKSVSCDTIRNLLPALDSFDKAFVSFKELDDSAKLKESFNILYRQMYEALSKMEVVKVKTAGEQFDPNYHEAIMQEETNEYPDNTIVMELQCGYMVKDKLVRPAMVKVASNPSGVVSSENKTDLDEKEV